VTLENPATEAPDRRGRHAKLARKVEELERSCAGHDQRIREIFAVLRKLLAEPVPAPGRPAIGFRPSA